MTILAATVLIAVDPVPTFNVEPSCRHVVAKTAPLGRMEACLSNEREARDQLLREWPQFTRAEKSECVELQHLAGEPSYVALLSCLELRRDARILQHQNEREAAASGGRGR